MLETWRAGRRQRRRHARGALISAQNLIDHAGRAAGLPAYLCDYPWVLEQPDLAVECDFWSHCCGAGLHLHVVCQLYACMSRGQCMDDTLNVVNLQVRISAQEHAALLALKERLKSRSLQWLVREILKDAISGKSGYPYPGHRDVHDDLERILACGGEPARTIKSVIRAVASDAASKQTKAG